MDTGLNYHILVYIYKQYSNQSIRHVHWYCYVKDKILLNILFMICIQIKDFLIKVYCKVFMNRHIQEVEDIL